ncbi:MULTISPECIES: hypothetical protein [unclassified Micromonospora]|uniref:hypothetical protein n=1 Tax=unclassified Micromonospora TaxID=2617518 RepID=UPI002FEECAE8
MTCGQWLSLIGGILELVAIGIAAVSAWRAYRKAAERVAVIRESVELHRDDAAQEREYRSQRGVEPDMTNRDVMFVRTWITYAISRSAARSALTTVAFLALGVVLSTAGNLVP